VTRCCRRSRGGHREGAGQGGEGRGAPEQRVDGKAVGEFWDGDVHRREGAPVGGDGGCGVLQNCCEWGKLGLAPIWEWCSSEGAHWRGGRRRRRSAKSDTKERHSMAGGGGLGTGKMGRGVALERGTGEEWVMGARTSAFCGASSVGGAAEGEKEKERGGPATGVPHGWRPAAARARRARVTCAAHVAGRKQRGGGY
jgi:hypothetical protein